ncbi:histidinol phosphate phosphatase [Helicobacter didelphidarum]|uniref:Histidinol-phosphatase n=1 Tax=Helicobacter didelphidarum TaxID=2040648 RepID=A0A3D8IQM1_9HELI|nr:histidinol-phosphatase [Helicobacter didelphidarum]RDU67569.1 histidinol phosphate phosphatase [Helicobacter didelphidarum]
MRVDLHNHTIYCNHASGSMDEYIQKALKCGIDIFGFSCHAPMNFDSKYRMDCATLPIYLKKIKDLQRLYSPLPTQYIDKIHNKIEILSALEVDYILGREDLILKQVLEAKVDYLIGSVHFLDEWGFDNPEFIGEWAKRGIKNTWEHYLDSLQNMAKTQYFQIVGHIDLPKIFGKRMPRDLETKMEETLQILYDNNMVIEINAAGLRKAIQEQYPSRNILEKIKEIGLDITLGSDAHSIEQIGYGYDVCINLIKDIGFDKIAIFRNKEKILLNI